MPPSDKLPYPLTFHGIAASRGDGLHPLLAEALARTGSVSGPPAPSEQTDENVVQPRFTTAKTDRRTEDVKDARLR